MVCVVFFRAVLFLLLVLHPSLPEQSRILASHHNRDSFLCFHVCQTQLLQMLLDTKRTLSCTISNVNNSPPARSRLLHTPQVFS